MGWNQNLISPWYSQRLPQNFLIHLEAEHIQTNYEQKQHNIYLNISSTTLNMAGWQAAASGCKGKDHEKVKYQKHFINNDSLLSGKFVHHCWCLENGHVPLSQKKQSNQFMAKALHTNRNRSSLGVRGLWAAFLLLLLCSTYTLNSTLSTISPHDKKTHDKKESISIMGIRNYHLPAGEHEDTQPTCAAVLCGAQSLSRA